MNNHWILLLLPISTLVLAVVKWRKTKDNGFLILAAFFVILPSLWEVADFFATETAKTAIKTGSAKMLFWTMAYDADLHTTRTGTLDPINFMENWRIIHIYGREMVKFILILWIGRVTMLWPGRETK
jgi:hypothetical protein